jgi:hypothetical protein
MSRRVVVVAAGLVAIAILGGCGGSGGSGGTASSAPKEEAPAARPLRLRVEKSPHRLPAPVSGEAVAVQGKSLLVIGGLDRSDVSIDSIVRLDGESGAAESAGTLSQPLHDAAATALPGGVLVFGGGSTTTIAEVERVVPGGAGEVVGEMPVARSDLSAVTIGGRAYVLGGYDGQEAVGAILRTSDGAKLETVAQLPVPVRYAAVATRGRRIYAFGGEESSGADSAAIQMLDTATGRASVIGRLPGPLAHASAIELGGRIYVLGGRLEGSTTDRILLFDPARGTAAPAGRLPFAVQNAAAGVSGGVGYLIGGLSPREEPLSSVVTLRLTPASPAS